MKFQRDSFLNEVYLYINSSFCRYHMKAFHKQATQYWIRSSQLFHLNLVRSPALFLVSTTDPVGSLKSNMRVRDSWESLGTKVSQFIMLLMLKCIFLFIKNLTCKNEL